MKKFLCLYIAMCLLMGIVPSAMALPESIQIVIGETYDFGEEVTGGGEIVSLEGSVLTGKKQGTGVVESGDEKCFVVVRDQNARVFLYGISRLMTLYAGESFALTGTIYSRDPIHTVTVKVGDEIFVTEPADGAFRYSMSKIDAKVKFGSLTPGIKRMTIDVETDAGVTNVWDVTFVVKERIWQRAENSMIYEPEPVAAFFGDDSYLFDYTMEDGNIIVDPEWVRENIVSLHFFYGMSYSVNKKALPNFEVALGTILNSQVEMQYADGEVRRCDLADLVMCAMGDGTYNARFTSGGENLSSHSFGTAIDINSALPVNRMKEENRAIIADAMAKLTYLGDGFIGNTALYRFSYDGKAPETGAVPDELKNCLLYEIAFAPAGFNWGYYFSEPCDPMHFTLTEIPANERVVIVK